MTRKAQAALEFLSTYGFAFLSLFLVLGVISYLGIFNVSSLRSNECRLPPGLQCRDFVFNQVNPLGQPGFPGLPVLAPGLNPYMRFIVTNNYGVNISSLAVPMSVNMTNDITNNQVVCSVFKELGGLVYPWQPSENRTIYCQLNPTTSFYREQRYEGTLELGFTQTGGLYPHHVIGTFSMVAR